jgi:predicted dehydrogenase
MAFDNQTSNPSQLTRRDFLAAASAAAITPALAQAQSPDGPKIKLGLIGCGGRGQWITNLFVKHGGYTVTACADYFEDRVNAAGEKFQVPANCRFTGLSGYKKLMEAGVDAVAIESPPYFHPEQAEAAVAAGKHVFVAKPIAVDVPGCQTIARLGKLGTEKKLCFLVDFQSRANEFYIEALKRVHAGALGTFCFGEAWYHCGPLRDRGVAPGNEGRLRDWAHDQRLSGDIIVEQNIHSLDVMNWIMRVPPLRCTGTGGRKSRLIGDTWDNYTCVFEYPDSVGFAFSSFQAKMFGTKGGIVANMFGSKGVLLTEYGGEVMIRGDADTFYRGGKTNTIFQEGACANIATFHKSITGKHYANPTVAPSVQSNLISILGRTATRRKKTVTWQEMLKSAEKIDAGLEGLKA